MNSFTFEQWIDYVRGVASPGLTRAMGESIEGGDAAARRQLELARSILEAAQTDARLDVPESVIRRAHGLFAPTAPESIWKLPALAADLVFDSLLSPQPAGLRSQGIAKRETVYRAGDFQVTLRLEQEPGTDFLALVGQVLPRAEGVKPVMNRPVFVFRKEKLVARTLSSDNGEFQMEFSGSQPLRLVVALASPESRIELDLEYAWEKKSRKPSKN